jgi:hypothetical protein
MPQPCLPEPGPQPSSPPYSHRLRPEDPRRIASFREQLKTLAWDSTHLVTSLSALFAAVDDLAQQEVRYYYRRRGTRACISGVTRTLAWMLGTAGLLLPLLAGADPERFKNWGLYGYPFLAAAASFLAANALFGGTEGHIRFVSTQLQLEKLITASRVEWCQYLAGPLDGDAARAQGFALILAYASSLHTTTLAETGHWGETLLAELAKYQKTIEAKDRPTP